MNSDSTDAFARSLAELRPAKAHLDPSRVFYEAGFAAGAAASRSAGVPLRMAASLLVAVVLAAGGGFYAGHQRGERTGYLAAVDSTLDSNRDPVASLPAAPEGEAVGGAIEPGVPAAPAARAMASTEDSHRPEHVAANPAPAWQWIFRQLDPHSNLLRDDAFAPNSPLRMRNSPEQWESLVNFRPAYPAAPLASEQGHPPRDSEERSPESPLTISPSEEWLRAITTF